jgi:uncharacterized cupin superfamily protein
MEKYIITKSEIESLEGFEKKHYLNPNAQKINKSLGDLTGITGFGFHVIEVPPRKESTEYHLHHFEDECVYILSGIAEVEIGEEVYQVSEGDFIGYRAGGLAHTMKNIGNSPLKCIVVGERLEHDVADYPRLNKRLYRNVGQPWELVDISNVSYPNADKKA